MKRIITLLILLVAVGCATDRHRSMSESEMLECYSDVPLVPDGMARMIDDMNRKQGIKDDSNYSQAFLTDLTQGQTALMTVQQIDNGDIATARRMLLTSVKLNAGFLAVYQKRAKIAPEALAEAKVFAKDVLDYLIAHKDELDLRFLDLRSALVGLAQLLADDPTQMRRLKELTASLTEKKRTDGTKPAVQGVGKPAPRP